MTWFRKVEKHDEQIATQQNNETIKNFKTEG